MLLYYYVKNNKYLKNDLFKLFLSNYCIKINL